MNESEFHYVDDASVAFVAQNTVGVVWADNRRQDVFEDPARIGEHVSARRRARVLLRDFGPQWADRVYLWVPGDRLGGAIGEDARGGAAFDGSVSISSACRSESTRVRSAGRTIWVPAVASAPSLSR
jgi:hypothetical protein